MTTDAYQRAVFFLAAERVASGARAYATELGIPGNEYATLNTPVLEAQLRSAEGHRRVAAAQMMRPSHLPFLERQHEAESDAQVRAALAVAGRRIAGERGAPPSALLPASERLAQLARLFGRDKGWLRWSTAAACLAADEDAVRAAAAHEPTLQSSDAYVFVAEGGRRPPALVPEQTDDREAALRLAHAALSRTKELALKDARTLALLWLRAQSSLWLPDLRYWLGLPVIASALEGVLLRTESATLQIHEGKVEGDADANAVVVLHHPKHGAVSPERPAPAWQTDRPLFGASDLPDFAAHPIELAAWKKRAKALGYEEVKERRAVIHTMRSVGGVRIHHSGHGDGYGDGPQTILSVSYPRHSEAAVSEVVSDIRRLLGIDPLPK